MSNASRVGTIGWVDLTIPDAPALRDFYQAVVGWDVMPEDMSGYQDYNMVPSTGGAPVAGICHARGDNARFPPQWLLYITVADVDLSMQKCTALGGKVLIEPKDLGSHGRMCVIQDPAGAVTALITPPAELE